MENGWILLDKPQNITSRKSGFCISKIFQNKKFGHLGTLDPMASGVLPIAIGKATKTIPYINNKYYKEYIFEIIFGFETDTLDITGNIINENDKKIDLNLLNNNINKFLGNIKQIPPMYSAININGKRAYNLARQGIILNLPKRDIFIKEISIIDSNYNSVKIKVKCSSGTYIRSLAKDICKKCNVLGTVKSIYRTESSGVNISQCVKLDFFEKQYNNIKSLKEVLKPIDFLLGDIPVINLNYDESIKILNGGFIFKEHNDSLIRIYNSDTFIGIGYVENKVLKPKRII